MIVPIITYISYHAFGFYLSDKVEHYPNTQLAERAVEKSIRDPRLVSDVVFGYINNNTLFILIIRQTL